MPIKTHALRFRSVFIFLIVCLSFFSLKLILIQIFRSTYLTNLAKRQQNYIIELEPKRGTIYDRNMRPFAFNISVYSLYAKPKIMNEKDCALAVEKLSSLLGLSEEYLNQRFKRKKYFVWIARKLPHDIVKEIKALKIHGLDFIKESKRYYPNQFLASHLIGFAGMDNQGLEGIELWYDQYLKGESGWSQILRDARQRELLIEKNYVPPKDGFNVVLTIDETIQYLAEKSLQKGFEKSKSKAAMIIVMNPKTGEILALANRPTYDLSQVGKSVPENRINRALVFTYEPGSVFKIVAASAALEESTFIETDKIFCENGKYKVGNHILKDHHPHGTLTFSEVFEQSSNIGVTKIAQKLGANKFYEYAHRFRFGMPTGINLPGEVNGWLKPTSQWSKTSIGAIPMGQEVTVTAIQLLSAISSIANDGIYMQPFVVKYVKDNQDEIIKGFEPTVLGQVISPETARRVKVILQAVVEKGTGKLAMIDGVPVAGKTGTAQKVVSGIYSHSKFYATFFGFAPVDDPKLAAIVIFDEPVGTYYGGTVAAPVFQEVIRDSLKYLSSQ